MSDPSLASAPTPAPGPTCAQHPEMPVLDTCVRCGTFLCARCRVRETPPRCAPCDARASDPLEILSDEFSVGRALRNGLTLYSKILPWVAGCALVFGMPATWIEHQLISAGLNEWKAFRFNMMYEALVGILGQLICYSAMISLAEGKGWSPKKIVTRAFSLWPRLFGTNILVGLLVTVGAILLVVPGVILALRYLVTTALVARGQREDILGASQSLTYGYKWRLLGLLSLVGVIVFVTIMIASTPSTLIFDEDSTPLLILLAEGWAGSVVMTFLDAVLLSAFYGLTKSRGQLLSTIQ